MVLEEVDKLAFKDWLLPKLAAISDADPDVLADYVVALLSSSGPVDQVKRDAVLALSDFLQDRTAAFVDQVVKGILRKTWLRNPGPAASIGRKETKERNSTETTKKEPVSPSLSQIPSYTRPSTETNDSVQDALAEQRTRNRPNPASRQENASNTKQRKRKLGDEPTEDRSDGQIELYNGTASGRPAKQTARRGRPTQHRSRFETNERRTSLSGTNDNSGLASVPSASDLPTMPQMDSTDPVAFAAAMTGFLSNMNFPNDPILAIPTVNVHIRCFAYDYQGFCFMGAECPYIHSSTPVEGAFGLKNNPKSGIKSRSKPGKTRSARNGRGGRAQAPFSRVDPFEDDTNTTLVVEQIPEEHFSEERVREFFSQFGEITDVQMQEQRRIAVILFSDHESAKRAYDSPKVIFGDRFVKVYWHNGLEGAPTARYRTVRVGVHSSAGIPEIYNEDEDVIDREVFEAQQAEAQRVFEERRKREEQSAAQAAEIQQKLKANQERINELRQKLVEKARTRGEEEISRTEGEHTVDNLSSLYAEALDHFARHRRGVTSTRGRGRGRGRRSYAGQGTRSAVKRLDNRPKRIAIRGIVSHSQEDDAIRTFLRNMEGCEDVHVHMEQVDTLIATFAQRWQAEMFLNDATHFHDFGKVQLSWVPNGESVHMSLHSEPERLAIKQEADGMPVIADEGRDGYIIKMEDDSGDEADLNVTDAASP